MPSEDQRLQDLPPLFSADIFRIFHDHVNEPMNHVADAIDSYVSAISDHLREVMGPTSWIPDSVKSSGSVIPSWQPPPPPPPSLLELTQRWISRNRAVSAAVVSFIGTGAFLIWRQRRLYRMKRRAKRAGDGGKMEVIVLAGSSHSPLASSLALDLDRRGFIVYITVSSHAEEEAVKTLQGKGIHQTSIYPLFIDLTSPSSVASAITNFSTKLLSSSSPNILRLASLIFLPPHPTPYINIPVHSIASSTWSSALNSQLIFPFTLARAFLPVLTAFAQDNKPQESIRAYRPIPFNFNFNFVSRMFRSYPMQCAKTSLIVLSHSITPSLCSANHAVENISFASVGAWLMTLQSELAASGSSLRVIHMRLGSFIDRNASRTPQELPIARQNYYTTKSNESPRQSTSATKSPSLQTSSMKGVLSRELHNGVFDAVVGSSAVHGGTLYLGRGSLIYGIIGSIFPRTIVGWMMSTRQRENRSENNTDTLDDLENTHWSRGIADLEDIEINVSQSPI